MSLTVNASSKNPEKTTDWCRGTPQKLDKLLWLISHIFQINYSCSNSVIMYCITQLLEQFNHVLLEKCSAGNCLLESICLIDKL